MFGNNSTYKHLLEYGECLGKAWPFLSLCGDKANSAAKEFKIANTNTKYAAANRKTCLSVNSLFL